MKYYDLKKAKRIINKLVRQGEKIESASLGIAEDEYSTADTVYNGKKWLVEEEKESKMVVIAGIDGSHWGTPLLRVYYTDKKQQTFECYWE